MADYTSTQAGDWNNAATWGGGGSPSSNGDTATIAHEVDYNLGDSAIDKKPNSNRRKIIPG